MYKSSIRSVNLSIYLWVWDFSLTQAFIVCSSGFCSLLKPQQSHCNLLSPPLLYNLMITYSLSKRTVSCLPATWTLNHQSCFAGFHSVWFCGGAGCQALGIFAWRACTDVTVSKAHKVHLNDADFLWSRRKVDVMICAVSWMWTLGF